VSFLIQPQNGRTNYCVVPDTAAEWTDEALDEVCRRFPKGSGRKILFVDCGCCNGRLKCTYSETSVPERDHPDYRLWKSILVKKLDGIHVIMRMTRQVNAEHPRARLFAGMMSKAIYLHDPECEKLLDDARKKAGLNLTEREKKMDSKIYGRRTPGAGKVVAKRVMLVMQSHIQLDVDTRTRLIAAGTNCDNVNSAHPGYPLITKKVRDTVLQQVVHCLNGCLDPEGVLAHSCTGVRNYRNTGIMLKTYSSPFGTSRCETVHSISARQTVLFQNITQDNFDARGMWRTTHFNRRKLSKKGLSTIEDGLAPFEQHDAKIIRDDPKLYFGFDYCRKVVADKNNSLYTRTENVLDEKDIADALESDLNDVTFGQSNADSPNFLVDDDGDDEPNEQNSVGLDITTHEIDGIVDADFIEEANRLKTLRSYTIPEPLVAPVPAAVAAQQQTQIRVDDLKETAVEAAALLKEKTGADWGEHLQTDKSHVNTNRNVARRRNLGGQITFFPVTYNEEMAAEWKRLFNQRCYDKSSIDRSIISDILQQYATAQHAESEKDKDDSTKRPLLPVGRQEAEKWLKEQVQLKNVFLKRGETSKTSTGITNDIQTVLTDAAATEGTWRVAPQGSTRIMSALASEHRQRAIDPTDRLPPVESRRCKLCKAKLGRGPEMHLKDECPLQPPEIKEATNKRKQERVERSKAYADGLEPRRKKARETLAGMDSHLRPANTDKRNGYEKCSICYYYIASKLDPANNFWHFRKNRQWLYCPFADPPSEREHHVSLKQEKRRKKYKTYYEKNKKNCNRFDDEKKDGEDAKKTESTVEDVNHITVNV
jgi:hypothetical protein